MPDLWLGCCFTIFRAQWIGLRTWTAVSVRCRDTSRSLQIWAGHRSLFSPSLIEGLSASTNGLVQLKKLKHLDFVGAPLRKALGDMLNQYVRVSCLIGSTEVGRYLKEVRDDEDWDWLQFMPCIGAEFEKVPNDTNLWELVFVREPDMKRQQQVFVLIPDMEKFRSGDLFVKYPTKPDLWQ